MIDELANRKLPPITEPNVETATLPNGAIVYYLKNAELPLFRMTAYFEMGAIFDDEAHRGLSDFFMSSWRSGGTTTLKPADVDAKIEYYAANFGAGAGDDLSTFSVECLQKDVNEVLAIYADLIKSPGFDADRMEIIRKGTLNSIKQRNEEPMSIAAREFSQSLYGEKSPHAWMSTPETVGHFDRATLENYYKANVATNHMWLVASSPLDLKTFLALMGTHFGGWRKELPKRDYPMSVTKEWQPSVEFIQKEGNQSAIVIGHFGEKRFNPERFRILLADEILGGSTFGSKLGDRIRTELGLAYGIASNFDFSSDYGRFVMQTRTKSESTIAAVNEIKRILSDMVTQKNVTQAELDLAKERILNRLVFQYADPFNIVNSQFTYDYYGYPPHYLQVFQKEVEAVTLDQVKDVLAKYFFPDRLKLMIVGDKSKIPDLKSLAGSVEKPLDME